MSFALTGSVTAGFNFTYTSTPSAAISVPAPFNFQFSSTVTAGTGAAGTADKIYAAQVTIAASGNTTVNIGGTPSTDIFGNTIVAVRLKFLYVNNTTLGSATSVTVGNATNPIGLFSAGTATTSVRNGGILLMGDSGATGYAVSNGATDTIKVVNADASNAAIVNLGLVASSA